MLPGSSVVADLALGKSFLVPQEKLKILRQAPASPEWPPKSEPWRKRRVFQGESVWGSFATARLRLAWG
jgi:hypothetical protein